MVKPGLCRNPAAAGAPCRPGDLRQGAAAPGRHPRLLRRRAGRQRRRPGPGRPARPARATLLVLGRRRLPPRHPPRSMPPPSSPSEGSCSAVFARGRVAAEVGDPAFQAMLDTEAAPTGRRPRPAWSRSRPPRRSPPSAGPNGSTWPSWGAGSAAAGNPVVPLVRQLRRPPARGRRPRLYGRDQPGRARHGGHAGRPAGAGAAAGRPGRRRRRLRRPGRRASWAPRSPGGPCSSRRSRSPSA